MSLVLDMAFVYMKDNLERRVNPFRSHGGDVLLEIEYADGTKYESIPFDTFTMFTSGPRVDVPDIKKVQAYSILMQTNHFSPQKSGDYQRMIVDWDTLPLDVSNLNTKSLLEFFKNREKALKHSHS